MSRVRLYSVKSSFLLRVKLVEIIRENNWICFVLVQLEQ